MDRSLSSAMSVTSLSPTGSSRGILYTVKSDSQQYGDFFAGFSWTHSVAAPISHAPVSIRQQSHVRNIVLLNSPRNAIALWTRCYGEVKIDRYDPTRKGAYYIAKLASQSGFDYIFENLDRLEYNGPKDLLAAAKKNPYLPQHVKATPRYGSLVLRDPRTRHPIGSASERSSSSISRSDMGDCV